MSVRRLTLLPEDAAVGVSILKHGTFGEVYPIVHCHSFSELLFIGQGRGVHCINGRHQLLEKGSLVYIRPDDVHSFAPVNYFDLVMYSMGIMQEEMDRVLSFLNVCPPEGELPPHVVLHGSAFAFTEDQLDRMLLEKAERRVRRFRSWVPGVLPQLLGAKTEPEKMQIVPHWLAELEETMRRRENYIAGLPRMLELCPYSQEYLNRMFRLHLKITPTEYINARRMVYATELLMEGKRSVTEIAYATGFNNLSHFYTVFRRQYGCSPKEFCAANRQ